MTRHATDTQKHLFDVEYQETQCCKPSQTQKKAILASCEAKSRSVFCQIKTPQLAEAQGIIALALSTWKKEFGSEYT